MKLILLTLVVVLASSIEAKSIPDVQTRDLSDFLLNELGLGPVWDTITGLGGNFASQIVTEGFNLIFAGQDKFNQAKEVFKTLVSDLTDHGVQSVQTATQMVQEAIREVSALLSGSRSKKDFGDFVLNTLGLQGVWDEIQNLGGNFAAQLIQEGMALLVSGSAVLDQAKEVFAQLVSDLTNHTSNASSLVQAAINQIAALLNQEAPAKRDFGDFLLNTLGLQGVWDEIQNLGGNFAAQLIQEGLALLTSGSAVFDQAKEVFAQLVSDLTNHTANASSLVQAAINQIAALLNQDTMKRNLVDNLFNTLGLGSVWAEIQGLGNNFVAQLLSEGMQLIVAGQAVIEQAKPIFAQLVSDLTAHTGDAVSIVQTAITQIAALLQQQNKLRVKKDFGDFVLNTLGLQGVWDEIQSLGGNFAAQLIQEGLALLTSGSAVFDQAKEVFAQLVSDLTNHTANASSLVQAAINQIAALLQQDSPALRNNFTDFLLNNLGLQGVWDEIQNLGSGFVSQLVAEAMQLLFAGQVVVDQAKEVFAQLVSDLTNHTANASSLVQAAINQVAALLNQQ